MPTIGLISDTHMPQRWAKLHDSIFDIFDGVDLVMHAGDVGQLWVLDQLSNIAPVIAVHGNDETKEATAALPFLTTVSVGGHRIVMTHSHYPDRATELEKRKIDVWGPKLDYRASFAKAHDAKIIVTGHTHIPMAVDHDGVLIINPGALASGSFFSRQAVQSVALLHLDGDEVQVEFVDVNTEEVFVPPTDIATGFQENFWKYQANIAEQALLDQAAWVRKEIEPLGIEVIVNEVLSPAGHKVWTEGKEMLTIQDVADAFKNARSIPPGTLEKLREHPLFAEYLG